MTPMIDVVFLLLVFFVCASVGQRPDELLPAVLGQGNTESIQPVTQPNDQDLFEHQQVRIRLQLHPSDPGGANVLLNELRVTSVDELERRLRRLAEIDAASPIILDIDDDVQVQNFIRIYDLCQLLKFESISFATRISGEP